MRKHEVTRAGDARRDSGANPRHTSTRLVASASLSIGVVLAVAAAFYAGLHMGTARAHGAPQDADPSASKPLASAFAAAPPVTPGSRGATIGNVPRPVAFRHGTAAVEPAAAPSAAAGTPLAAEQAQWSSEETDTDWTQNTKKYLTDMLESQNASPSILRTIDCRQTLCRVELEEDDMDALRGVETSLKTDGYRFSYAFGDLSQIIVFVSRDLAGMAR